MSSFQLKMVALIAMIVDHIGLFFFPEHLFLRAIGRLSFPLFAWLIANGARHTQNIDAYLKRLLIWALIAQIPFVIANMNNGSGYWFFNVLFTLFFGLLGIKFLKNSKSNKDKIIITAACALAAVIFNTDYAAFGVVSIILFYLFYNNFKWLVLTHIILFSINWAIDLIYLKVNFGSFFGSTLFYWIKPLSLVSLVFIGLYNGQRGSKAKWFYLAYPLQYAVIVCLQLFT